MATIEVRNSKRVEKSKLKLEVSTKFFRALGDATRLQILDSLIEGEKNVGQRVELVGLSMTKP